MIRYAGNSTVRPNGPKAGAPHKHPFNWTFCPKCMGITKHRWHSNKQRWICTENAHSRRAAIVTLLKYKVLANPLHECYDGSNQPE